MSEKETLGMNTEVTETKEISAEKKAKQKKVKYTIAKIVVALCVVLCIVLTVFELGVTYRTVKAAEVDGTEYSVAEYNWLYTTSVYDVYNSYYQTYGQLASYFFNPSSPLDEQQYSEDKTWHDYIKDRTDNTLVELTELYNAGVEAGYELSEEDKASVENEWEAMKKTAASYGYTADDYCEMNYGRGVNEKVFKAMSEKYLYAFGYAEDYMNGQEVTKEDIDTYYAENAENFDNVTFNYYFANGAAAEGEEAETAMADAKAEAEKVLSGEDEEKTLTEQKYAVKSSINELYRDWLFDSARVAGDKEIFEAETGYYVVEFVAVNDLHYNTVDVRHILVQPASAEDDEAKEAANKEALKKAEMYKAEFEGNPTEENFAELAKKYSVDGSASNGGLYENVYKGQMVTEFEDWCFDAARKPGDCEIVETTYGYHVMYFSAVAEEYYDYAIDNSVRANRYTAHLNEITEGVEVKALMGANMVAKHYN